MPTNPSIVFCHGIWADGSCFYKVIPALQAEGYEVIAAQYGLDTLAGDVATVKRTLARVGRPALLVGHSYGGTVITAAGTDDRVAGLVYVGATRDHTVQPGRQRCVARRMGAGTRGVGPSHVPMLSKPNVGLDVIRSAAAAIGQTGEGRRAPLSFAGESPRPEARA